MTTIIQTVADLIKKYPSPISELTRLAQFVHETNVGTSKLFLATYNGFGIKASAPWQGASYNHLTGEHVDGKDIQVRDYFRKYDSIEASVKDHASFFESTKTRKQVYKEAILATNYTDECYALTETYATDPKYGDKLLKVIREHKLESYLTNTNKGEDTTMVFPKPKMTDRRKQALGYPGHGVYPKRSLTAIKLIVWHYTATTHAGHGSGVIKNHENYWRTTHGWDIGGYHYYIDRQGNIFWNYDLSIATYGAGPANPHAMHISLEASSATNYTSAQVKAREELTLWLLTNDLKHLTGQSMRGHKEVPGNSTTCPGYSIDQLNQFRKGLDKKLAAGGTSSTDTHNPQGMKEFAPVPFKEPRLPFDEKKVGDTVTISPNWSWYNPSTGKLMTSARYNELIGTKDKIVEIKEITPAGHSRCIFRLEKYNSWIMQEHVDESKASWELVKEEPTTPVEKIELQDGEYLDKNGVVWVWKKKEEVD